VYEEPACDVSGYDEMAAERWRDFIRKRRRESKGSTKYYSRAFLALDKKDHAELAATIEKNFGVKAKAYKCVVENFDEVCYVSGQGVTGRIKAGSDH
jgi:hypothetical protein